MKPQVIISPQITKYFRKLMRILIKKGYFSFEENANGYVNDLVIDITINLPNKSSKQAPKHFEKYGKNLYFASFKKNKQTTWYVFFTIHHDETKDTKIFLIRYVSNNHMIAKYL